MQTGGRGDGFSEQAFLRLLKSREGRIYGYFRRCGLSAGDAEDLCQEAFLTLWKSRERVRSGKEASFLLGICRRLLLAHRRNHGSEPTVSLEESPPGAASTPARPARLLADAPTDSPGGMRLTLESLPRRQRQVIEMVWLGGLARREAARDLGIAEGSLRTHERRALAALRRVLPIGGKLPVKKIEKNFFG